MPQAYVRIATERDLPSLRALRQRWVEEQVGGPVVDDAFAATFDGWAAKEKHQRVTWLAEIGSTVIGMLNLVVFSRMPRPIAPGQEDRPTQWGYIANVYVEASARNAGCGRMLIEAALAYADDAGYARVVLAPTARARPLYEDLGFGPATELMVWHPHRP